MPFQELRRALAQAGATIATTRAPGSHGRAETAETRPARLVEEAVLRARPVGAPEACPEPLAFLDGIQRHQVVGYVGAAPVIGAVIAAAVRERRGRELGTVVHEMRRLLLARPAALETLVPPAGYAPFALADDAPWHPIQDIDAAVALIDGERTRLEVRSGEQYRRRSGGWLIIDGSLAESPAWASDPRMLGVAKSHASLPFQDDNLLPFLRLPVGCRSSVFQPDSRRVAPVYAWGLRLWPWEDRDLLYGLVRVEAAPTDDTLARADTFSRWILAERAPISSGDARWDRLLYGIHAVEEYLRAATDAP